MTSLARSATSDSTQPPDTEPASSPRSETASFDPTGRGAERRVATTVAIATRSPRARHRSMSAITSFIGVIVSFARVREVLDQIEEMLAAGGEDEGVVSLALVAGSEIELPEDELNAALRRAMLLLAAGGDPRRELDLHGRAVAALGSDLDAPDRRMQLAEKLATLRSPAAGLPLVEGALARLLADRDLAWQAFACAVLAHELGS
jgi:hypothetical protein